MITRKDDSRRSTNSYPAGRFKGLCSLIDEQSRKLLTFHYPAVCTNEGRSNDTCLSKQLGIDTYLKLSSTALQPIHLLMIAFRTFLSIVPQFTNSLPNRPQLRVIRMRFKLSFVCETQHLIVHSGRITNAKDIDTTVDKLLTNPVYSHITLRTNHHLTLSHQCFVDRFDQCCCLTRSRWTMNYRHILCP